MTNWRQIQARIRKARTGADAPAKLLDLFEKTHDAMVAFELARAYEKDARNAEAIEWYAKSFERFRRDDWKKKVVEAITRLGGTPPDFAPAPEPAPGEARPTGETAADAPAGAAQAAAPSTHRSFGAGLPLSLFHSPGAGDSSAEANQDSETQNAAMAMEAEGSPQFDAAAGAESAPGAGNAAPGGKRRRRGRRGGRGRRKSPAGTQQGRPAGAAISTSQSGTARTMSSEAVAPPQIMRPVETERPRTAEFRPATLPPGEAQETGWVGPRSESLRARAGDPAMASQVAQLEMQLRRLIACPPYGLDDADKAPAGPGVLILSDSDLATNYYVVACATLRIEMGRLGRSDRGSRGRGPEPSLRGRLAEHLGISESQVTRYLSQHCVARWLQLDEGASRLAHFAIAVLRPPLND